MAPHVRSDTMQNWHLASRVRRYHTWPMITEETVGQHSHGVLMIFLRYFARVFTAERVVVIVRWIAEHDLPELWTGDSPFPVKARYPALKEALAQPETDAEIALGVVPCGLNDGERAVVKICDLLQMHLYGRYEHNLGNRYALPIVHDTLTAATTVAADYYGYVTLINNFVEDHRD